MTSRSLVAPSALQMLPLVVVRTVAFNAFVARSPDYRTHLTRRPANENPFFATPSAFSILQRTSRECVTPSSACQASAAALESLLSLDAGYLSQHEVFGCPLRDVQFAPTETRRIEDSRMRANGHIGGPARARSCKRRRICRRRR